MITPRSIILLLCLVLFASTAHATSNAQTPAHRGLERLTNGQRLARGLPPNKPKRLYDPTKTSPRLSRRSISPNARVHIAATNKNGVVVGYLLTQGTATNPYNPQGTGWVGITPVDGDSFDPVAMGTQQVINLYPIDSTNPDGQLAIMDSGNGDIGSGPGYGILVLNDFPGNGGATNVWDIPDGYPGSITADYPNSDQTSGIAKIYWDQGLNQLYAAGAASDVSGAGLTEDDEVTLALLSS